MPVNGERQLIALDGADQLSRGRWRRVRRVCRRCGNGLLVTTHADLGVPTLCRLSVTVETAETVVARLLEPTPVTPPPGLVRQLLEQHQGNLRLTLFALYDWYEGWELEAGAPAAD